MITGVVFIDLHKAFDTVDLDMLLFGVEGVKDQWIWSYLTARSQSVTVDGYLSHSLSVSIGVPQGSILSLLLFLLFLNDFPNMCQSCVTTMCAVNTECESASTPENYKKFETTINNHDLHKVKEYFDTYKLSFIVPKLEFMLDGIY